MNNKLENRLKKLLGNWWWLNYDMEASLP